MRVLRCAVVTALLLAGFAASTRAQAVDAGVQLLMSEAHRHFEALEYEQTVPPLERVVALLQDRDGAEVRAVLTEAFAMLGRSRYGMNDPEGARRDFAALLKLNPSYEFGGEVSPRVTGVFDDVRKETIGTLRLSVTPATAELTVDGLSVNAVDVPLASGSHRVTASQPGFGSVSRSVTIVAGSIERVHIELTRTAALLVFVTSPADVEVLVDGRSRGRTAVRPLPEKVAARVTGAGMDVANPPGLLTVSDIGAGAHRVEFRRACFSSVAAERTIEALDDYIWDPVTLSPAVAPLTVPRSSVEQTVFVDGENRGLAPFTGQLCAGPHMVELRGATGRYQQKIDAKPGEPIEVLGALRPAFALVSSTQTSLNADLRGAIERAVEPARSLLVFAPPAEALQTALLEEHLPPDWLGYDANRRPFGVSAEATPAMRRDLSSKLSRAFDAQGIAAVTAPITANRTRLVLTLLSAGMADPDVVELNLDQPETIASALAQLDRPLSFFTHSIGLSTVDIVAGAGPVIASVDSDGPAARAGLSPGDTLLTADGTPLADSAALTTAVDAHAAGSMMTLQVRNIAGVEKQVPVAVLRRPRLLGIADQTLMANRTLAALRARLAASTDADERAVITLNLAAALIRLEAWNDARTELERVTLADGPGVGNGTTQYLLGLCATHLGDRAAARAAFTAAAASSSLLTEDGPAVRDLAQARLAELGGSLANR